MNKELDLAQYFEAWGLARGVWTDVLLFLARKPGLPAPASWWEKCWRHTEDSFTKSYIRCCICGEEFEWFLNKAVTNGTLTHHGGKHLREVAKVLNVPVPSSAVIRAAAIRK